MEVTIGCDPELFVVNSEGKYRSAHGMVPGTKESPHVVNGGAVQVDGMALEFNTDPAKTADEFVTNIKKVMDQLQTMIPADHKFAIVPSCRFNGNHFRAQPDEAKELGCTPDFDAYTLAENPKPDNKTTMRTASGHIHLGFINGANPNDPAHMVRCATLMKQMDWYLGLPSLFFDSDKDRRKMYGKAGCFRPKPYGAEYRTLSNAWLLTEDRQRFVFEMAQRAVSDLVAGKRRFENKQGYDPRHYINNSDKASAQFILTRVFENGEGLEIIERASAL